MRVISGSARGTKLKSLDSTITRPTLDRVKEALFNIINFNILDSNVLDLFAGSGALGIEALSRGAQKVIFCDNSSLAVNIIQENLEKTNLKEKAIVINKDYNKTLEQIEDMSFDIIFIDPPYETNFGIKAIEKIANMRMLSADGIVILETDNKEQVKKLENAELKIYDVRKYGRVSLIFLNRKG